MEIQGYDAPFSQFLFRWKSLCPLMHGRKNEKTRYGQCADIISRFFLEIPRGLTRGADRERGPISVRNPFQSLITWMCVTTGRTQAQIIVMCGKHIDHQRTWDRPGTWTLEITSEAHSFAFFSNIASVELWHRTHSKLPHRPSAYGRVVFAFK